MRSGTSSRRRRRSGRTARPIGIEIIATSEGGIASRKVFFRARELDLPPRFHATMSVKSTSVHGDYREFDGSAVFTLRSAFPGPDGSLNAWYDVEQSTVTHALATLFKREGCRYEATGAGGQLESGDLELRVLPDGELVYAFMLDQRSRPATSRPTAPRTPAPPIPIDLPAHLDTRRPGAAAQSLRPLPADFHHQMQGATDVKSALMDANAATWTLTPQW